MPLLLTDQNKTLAKLIRVEQMYHDIKKNLKQHCMQPEQGVPN
jgi:virulence-associated protein VapD